MRRVNWTGDERVDIPDLTAMSGLNESEFRRQLSMLLQGADQVGVLRGFEVEPESPASSRVVIRMDRTVDAVPGRTESLAIGGENLGATIDYGILIGGRSSDGSLEGPSQAILDFALLPADIYLVEMRAATTTGATENRVFWNPTTESEYVDSVPTRVQPMWEAQIVPAISGGEWIPLALVVWGGGTIISSNIVDGRDLIFEGAPSYTAADQDEMANDFDRSTARGDFAVTIASVFGAIKALQRQVADLKGQNNAGRWDWYSRVFTPDALGEASWDKQTKSLRSVDTVTYTIGDNITEWGDFNGANGLKDCLTYIDSVDAFLPTRIVIIIKKRYATIVTPARFVLDTAITIANKHLEIIGQLGHGGAAAASDTGPSGGLIPNTARGQHVVRWDLPDGVTGLRLTGRSSLKLVNMDFQEITNEANGINVAGPVILDNVIIRGRRIGDGWFGLQCHSEGTQIQNSYFEGEINIGGRDGDVVGDSALGGHIKNCRFEHALFRLRNVVDTSAIIEDFVLDCRAVRLRVQNCSFMGRVSMGVNGYTEHEGGCIDARGAQECSFVENNIFHSADENGIHVGSLPCSSAGTLIPAHGVEISKNQFGVADDETHAADAGVGGTDGSGHHIFVKSDGGNAITEQIDWVWIRDNVFQGVAGGSPDASAIRVYAPRHLWIENNVIELHGSASDGTVMISIRAQGSLDSVDVHINDNFVGDWTGNATKCSGIEVSSVRGLWIENNTISKYRKGVTSIVAIDSDRIALLIEDIEEGYIRNNTFVGWRALGQEANVAYNNNLALGGDIDSVVIDGNNFNEHGGSAIWAAAASSVSNSRITNNQFRTGDNNTKFRNAIDLQNATTTDNMIIGNRWNYAGVGGTITKDAVWLGADLRFVLTNNHFDFGFARHGSLGGVVTAIGVGYGAAHAAAPTNVFAAYL